MTSTTTNARPLYPEHPELAIPGVSVVVAPDAPREVWEAARRDGVGGSDVAAAAGISTYTSTYRLWAEKTGRPTPPKPARVEQAARWGHILEAPVRDEFQWEHPEYLVTPTPGTLAVTGSEWIRVNVDGLVWAQDGRLAAVYEGKTGTHRQLPFWADEDQVPIAHAAQVQWAMYVTGAPCAWVVGLLDTSDYRERLIVRDEDLIADLLDLATEFWSYVVDDVPPPVDGSESTRDTLARVAERAGSTVELDVEWAHKILRMHELNAQIKKAKAAKEVIGNELRAAMGEHSVATLRGQKVATHTASKPSRECNYDRLLSGWPDAYEACVTEKKPDPGVPPARTLTATRSKDAFAVLEALTTTSEGTSQ